MRRFMLVSAAVLCMVAPLRAQSDLAEAWGRARGILATDPAARGGAVPPVAIRGVSAAPEIGYHRYAFSIRSGLQVYAWTRLFMQPATLDVRFDMEDSGDRRGERRIKNVEFSIALVPDREMPTAYVLASPGPDSVLDFYPPDPGWGRNPRGYAREEKDGIQFFIEAGSNIDARARGSVFEAAVTTLDNGRTYGAKAIFRLLPYCTRDLSSCRLGQLSGVDFDQWGLGFRPRMDPGFLMRSEVDFPIARVAAL